MKMKLILSQKLSSKRARFSFANQQLDVRERCPQHSLRTDPSLEKAFFEGVHVPRVWVAGLRITRNLDGSTAVTY